MTPPQTEHLHLVSSSPFEDVERSVTRPGLESPVPGPSPRFLLLGPVEALEDDGSPVDLGGPQRRAILALLLLHPRTVVSVDTLCRRLWGEAIPAHGAKSIQIGVSRLRRLLPDGTLVTRAPGYIADVAPEAVDVCRFDQLTRDARADLAAGRNEASANGFSEALALWRGPALADLHHLAFVMPQAARLTEARQQACEDQVDAELALGRHRSLVSTLEGAVVDQPLRERRWAQLMTALYRCGRQADALAAYRRVRRQLVEEVGIDPGLELRKLEQDILSQRLPIEPPAPVAIVAEVAPEPSEPAVPSGLPPADPPWTPAPIGPESCGARWAHEGCPMSGPGALRVLMGRPWASPNPARTNAPPSEAHRSRWIPRDPGGGA